MTVGQNLTLLYFGMVNFDGVVWWLFGMWGGMPRSPLVDLKCDTFGILMPLKYLKYVQLVPYYLLSGAHIGL